MQARITGKLDIFKILLFIFSLSFIGILLLFSNQNNTLTYDKEGLIYVEYISSGIQRVSKLELENNSDPEYYISLEKVAEEIFPDDNEDAKYFSENGDISGLIIKLQIDGELFRDAVYNYKDTGDRTLLFSVSEINYNNSLQVITLISNYIEGLSDKVSNLGTLLICNVIILALLLIKIIINTLSELQKNKELSKDMFIDTATGLLNGAKCQEVLKSPIPANNPKERAIIIFDLNDLKKTNDLLGHRAGDQLIFSFGEQLNKGRDIFSYEVFVGRYGGDEFMAYFESANEDEVESYINEVNNLMDTFNKTQNKPYNLSCAAGYSITTAETKNLTMQELFDQADEDMYKNKIAMKEKKRKMLKETGVEEAEFVDDRL